MILVRKLHESRPQFPGRLRPDPHRGHHELDPRSRDDIPAVLKGIQHIYCDAGLRESICEVLEQHLPRKTAASKEEAAGKLNPTLGRPGMELWSILVLALLEQGIDCDFDRRAELANKHVDARSMLGLSDSFSDRRCSQRTVVRNVGLPTPELLAQVNRPVGGAGLELAGAAPEEPLKARADSFVVETDVHCPTGVNLLWDA